VEGISIDEYRVFSSVLYKLWVMDPKKRKFHPCWRSIECLVFVVAGVYL